MELADLGWGVAVLLLLGLAPMVWVLIRPRSLPDVDEAQRDWPSVAVIVPSRNEGRNVERAFKTLLGLTYPHLSIIALNDRSTDDTGEILDQLAASDQRAHVIHVEELPDGWLGKNHANHIGAEFALERGADWLLFTDGDILFAPDTVQRAVRAIADQGRDHLTLWPRMEPAGWAEQALLTTFALFFQLRFGVPWVRSRIKQFYVGVGAFNLVSRRAYQAFGGHQTLALEVVDDVKLGKLVKREGYLQDALDGQSVLSVRWQEGGVRGVVGGLMKNTFASQGFSVLRVVVETAVFGSLFLAPPVVTCLWWDPRALGFQLATLLLLMTYALVAWRARTPISTLLVFPLMCWIFPIIMWRSMFLTLRQGGVKWRDTFYPLKVLKQGQV